MKRTSAFFSILLLIWVSFSTYWYVCKIKNDCNNKKQTSISIKANDIKELKKDSIVNNRIEENKEKSFAEELSKGFTIYNFPKNSASKNRINDDFMEFADELNNYLKENANSKVEIIGYTDNSGSRKFNLEFGKKRANFIMNKLINAGVDKKNLITKSFGEENPIATNETEEGRLKNRRVFIKLIKNK